MYALDELSWQHSAACRGVENPDELFFPERNAYSPLKITKEMCASCPVRRDCLGYALKYNVKGIWGGTTEKDRLRIRSMTGVIPIRVQLD